MRPYHFVRLDPDGFAAFRRRVEQAGGAVCVDLEDSVDSPDPAARRALKARRRREVVALLHAAGPDAAGLFVRISAPGTDEYQLDLDALRSVAHLPGLFLPKTERAADVAALLGVLPAPAVVPVVESERGFAAIAGLRAAGHPALTAVAFGHCDYNLNRGLFPFAHQDDARYWAWVRRLDAAAQRAGLATVHSPVLRLDDLSLFRSVVARLAGFRSASGQVTLSLAQTQACTAPGHAALARRAAASVASVHAAAQRTVRQFEAHRRADGHFALDAARTLVSPQEYRAACAVLAAGEGCTVGARAA